jgi:hypothetical protein
LTGAVTQVAFNDERGFQLGNFSTDGNWLVYSRRNEDLDDEVYLFEIANGAEHDVTQDPFRDTEGLITPDGRHVVFRSNRDDGTYQLFTVSLARLSEDPDDPLVRERRSLERRRADRGRGGEGNRGGGGGADTGGGQAQGEAAAGGDQAQDEAGAATELGTGFELAPAGDRYVVSYIYRDGPADKEWIDLQVGDAVVAIDHQRIAAPNNYWEILNHTLNDYVTVTVDASARASNAGGNGDAGASGVRGFRVRRGRGHRLRQRDPRHPHPHGQLPARHQVRGVGREQPPLRRGDLRRPDRLRPHPGDEPAVAGALSERDRPLLERPGHRDRHPLQRRTPRSRRWAFATSASATSSARPPRARSSPPAPTA